MNYLYLDELTDELTSLRDLVAAHEAGEHATSWDGCPTCDPDSDEADRLAALTALDDDLGGLADYARNESVAIDEADFVAYAEDLAADLGLVSDTATWPGRWINWEAAAKELSQDYMEFEFEGTTYLIRNY